MDSGIERSRYRGIEESRNRVSEPVFVSKRGGRGIMDKKRNRGIKEQRKRGIEERRYGGREE